MTRTSFEEQMLRAREDAIVAAVNHLRAVARWSMQVQLAGKMPSRPAQNPSLRTALANEAGYLQRLMVVSEKLGEWIVAAQGAGHLNRELPPEVVLYTLFARACDPVLGLLKLSGQHSDELDLF